MCQFISLARSSTKRSTRQMFSDIGFGIHIFNSMIIIITVSFFIGEASFASRIKVNTIQYGYRNELMQEYCSQQLDMRTARMK